ncbi:MAG: hypothetical protein WCO35_02485 [Candidatus Nomurabacteria bacterium]
MIQNINKKVYLLYIVSGEKILLRKNIHQNINTFDVFNLHMENEDIQKSIKQKLKDIFSNNYNDSFKVVDFGKIFSNIKKDGYNVNIEIEAFKLNLSESLHFNTSYRDDLVSEDNNLEWIDKNFILVNNENFREGDKKVLLRVFENRKLNIKMEELQPEKWIEAKLLKWEDL